MPRKQVHNTKSRLSWRYDWCVSVGGIKTFHKIFKDLIFENIQVKAHLSIAVITILKMK